MFKNKLFMFIIALLIVITLIVVAFLALWNIMDKNNQPTDPNEAAKASVSTVSTKPLKPSEIKAHTVFVKDVMTNLADKGRAIKASFAFEMDSKKGKDEFETLDFKMKNILLQTMADMKADQIQGSQGQEYLISTLMNKINDTLKEGKVKQISITDYYVE